jgi:hypothetical protein
MFGIYTGPGNEEKAQYGNLSQASGFATNLGESDVLASSNFMNSILSGDPTRVAGVLAPQISAAKKSAQSDLATRTMFGDRTGGNTAANASTSDKVHSDITDLIGSLTGSAASGLGSTGSSLLGSGMSGFSTLFDEGKTLQAQRAAKLNDIFSSSAGVASSVLGAIPGNPGGFADIGSNVAGGLS